MLLRLLLLCAVEFRTGDSVHSASLVTFRAFSSPVNESLPPLAESVDGLVRTIDRIYHGGGKAGYLLYLDGKRFQLDMERDEALLSHHFSSKYVTALLGAEEGAPPLHRECVYRGTVDLNPESLAVFTLCGGGLEGFFAVEHTRYIIRPLIRAKGHENDVHVIEDADAERALHYYIRESFSFEEMPTGESCGTRERRRRKDPSGKRRRKGRGKSKNRHRGYVVKEGENHGAQGRGWWEKFSKPLTSLSDNVKRRKRSVSRARNVELLLVADESMSKKYGKDLNHYLLTLASIASKLYGHASIENPIRLSVVKVTTVTEKEKGLEVSKNAAATLKSFCKWQNQQNPLDDDHQHHHDAAILFTRQVNKHQFHESTLRIPRARPAEQTCKQSELLKVPSCSVIYTVLHVFVCITH